MPCYLVHGFRWPRRAIRIHIILENIDEAAAEYLVAPKTSTAMLENFHHKFPNEMKILPKLRFVEQYDPRDTSSRATSQPHAFVVNKIKPFDLSINVKNYMEDMDAEIGEKQMAALQRIKEQLAPDEPMGWYVVYNGDETRMGEEQAKSRVIGQSFGCVYYADAFADTQG